LSAGVRSARASAVRCLKAMVVGGDGARTLALACSLQEEPGAALEAEWERCVKNLIDSEKPCLLLLRTDEHENIDGSRWLLVAWLPQSASEAERALYMRSRSLLADLVPQPYFLRELLASDKRGLSWSAACAAMAQTVGALRARSGEEDIVGEQVLRLQRQTCSGGHIEGPVTQSQSLAAFLGRLVKREDSCLRLVLSTQRAMGASSGFAPGEGGATGSQRAPPLLEAKVVESRTPRELAKAGLPSGACFFALCSRNPESSRDDLIFVHWCPDRVVGKDSSTRSFEDTRYAVLKGMVLQIVLAAFPHRPRVLQVDAREPEDITAGTNRAVEAADGTAPGIPAGAVGASEDRRPTKGYTDWPADWPEASTAVAMPASLALPRRPVPHWRGGSKAHSISGFSAPSVSSFPMSRTKATRAIGGFKI
ncbi:unnamed protein product, partial [Polarella glacialis]